MIYQLCYNCRGGGSGVSPAGTQISAVIANVLETITHRIKFLKFCIKFKVKIHKSHILCTLYAYAYSVIM